MISAVQPQPSVEYPPTCLTAYVCPGNALNSTLMSGRDRRSGPQYTQTVWGPGNSSTLIVSIPQ